MTSSSNGYLLAIDGESFLKLGESNMQRLGFYSMIRRLCFKI